MINVSEPRDQVKDSYAVYLQLCPVSLNFLDVTRHSVNLTQTVLILLKNTFSTLCVPDDHFHSL